MTPLKHINMYKHQLTKENIDYAVAYLKSGGKTAGPGFVTVDSRASWSYEKNHLYWQANDGSTGRLEVIALEDVEDFVKKQWYRQDMPSGIVSLHNAICKDYLGISRADVKKFVKKQKVWQLMQPLRNKTKHRRTILAKRPFQEVQIDLGDCISFEQTLGPENPRYFFLMVCGFSGFAMAEVQADKESHTTLGSFKKCLVAIKSLGYVVPEQIMSDQGSEFSGKPWEALAKKHGWKHKRTRDYPATRVERKVQTVKRYLNLNSRMLYGDGTKWFNVLSTTLVAVNKIRQENGASPFDIVRMDLKERRAMRDKQQEQRRKEQERYVHTPKATEPNIGDSVRVRLPGEKLPMDYKGHLPYRRGVPVKWSEQLYRVSRKRLNRQLGSVKLLVGNRWRFWPAEVMLVPPDTVDVPETWGQDGNVDYKAPRRGTRRSERVRKRRAHT